MRFTEHAVEALNSYELILGEQSWLFAKFDGNTNFLSLLYNKHRDISTYLY